MKEDKGANSMFFWLKKQFNRVKIFNCSTL